MHYFVSVCRALDCSLNGSDPVNVAYTLTVDKSGNGNFTTIQEAIDSIPLSNSQWVRISVASGTYTEKVTIQYNKTCIYLEGAGSQFTSIEWNDHEQTDTSATFTSFSDNFVAKGITFKNTYVQDVFNYKPALAARIYGDKSAFYHCSFVGLQDTLWDATGRHYYNNCYFEGVVDFIFGYARSIFQGCLINVTVGIYAPIKSPGSITAQGRKSKEENNGFVFKDCVIEGTGKAYIGRAYGAYSTVIVYNSQLSDVIDPRGWSSWLFPGQEENFLYVEASNRGAEADTSKRVPWLKTLNDDQLNQFVDISYIDNEGWISKLPKLFYVCKGLDCTLNGGQVAKIINVDKSGQAEFATIQSAIDSVPPNNNQWIKIQISHGVFREKVNIPGDKSCIYLNGGGSKFTFIEWNDHELTGQSATFTSNGENIVARGITFVNTYNSPLNKGEEQHNLTQAVAAFINGDKTAFYHCAFAGVQDTLYDQSGRHYFRECYIQGAVDFIFGNGQSIYEGCTLNYSTGVYGPPNSLGYITAQGRESESETSGFVFKSCTVTGTRGKTYLGRAYRAYSRVIFANSVLTDVVQPLGWDAWFHVGHEEQLTFAEANCIGAGADISQRVPWIKTLNQNEVDSFTSLTYIDGDGWMAKLPPLN
ncbi:pectinesterase QRT1 [Ziziphus jujuba]|uniref:Pectinesterase n=1 Tax=Ziziphus jujuba TaxID=326968 RepID=A0ABM4AHS3_ZIZJJ|nr:pectinesterase QRT1 [Ziziphus jujuba]